jgi:hypothetical protein
MNQLQGSTCRNGPVDPGELNRAKKCDMKMLLWKDGGAG